MNMRSKAAIYAMIDIRIEQERRNQSKIRK